MAGREVQEYTISPTPKVSLSLDNSLVILFMKTRNVCSSCRRDGIRDEVYLSFKVEDGYLKR